VPVQATQVLFTQQDPLGQGVVAEHVCAITITALLFFLFFLFFLFLLLASAGPGNIADSAALKLARLTNHSACRREMLRLASPFARSSKEYSSTSSGKG
jgi:hypothetical protein